ncbi:MAG TPA: ABC transporter permease [Actinomycetota bacterium]|nr:ABC transporter permease [Actinomycetota bacterium]
MSAVAAPRRRLDVSLRHALRYWNRNAVVFRRVWLLGLMAWFMEPVIYLVAMGLGLGQYLESVRGVRYIEFIAPGLLAVSAMYGATFEATWNAHFKMERQRIYDAASATPVSVPDVALGEVLWASTRATIYGGAFAVIATAFGLYRSWWGLLTVPGIAVIGFVFSVMGLSYTYFIRRVDFLAYYWTMLLTPMFMFSGVFFPLDRLPDWLRTVAWFMPLYHGTELMRALMSTGEPARAAGHALWLMVTGLGMLWLPLYLLDRRLSR